MKVLNTLRIVRPSLFRIRHGCRDLSDPDIPEIVRRSFAAEKDESPSESGSTHVKFLLAEGDRLYCSLDDRVSSQIGPFQILLLHRAKGPGFVEIGPDWGSPLCEFEGGCTEEGLDQARSVGNQLEALLGYKLLTKDYGSDF